MCSFCYMWQRCQYGNDWALMVSRDLDLHAQLHDASCFFSSAIPSNNTVESLCYFLSSRQYQSSSFSSPCRILWTFVSVWLLPLYNMLASLSHHLFPIIRGIILFSFHGVRVSGQVRSVLFVLSTLFSLISTIPHSFLSISWILLVFQQQVINSHPRLLEDFVQ